MIKREKKCHRKKPETEITSKLEKKSTEIYGTNRKTLTVLNPFIYALEQDFIQFPVNLSFQVMDNLLQ